MSLPLIPEQSPEQAARAPKGRADNLPAWVILLLVFFLALRVFDLYEPWAAGKSGHLSQQLAGAVDDKTMTVLIQSNTQAKAAFSASLGKMDGSAPDAKGLRAALKEAEALQLGTQNSPGAARRVIILRALLKLPLMGPGRNGLDPAKAFQAASLAALPPADARAYAAEGRLWQDVARGPHLSPAQTAAYAAALRATPNIRWWLSPALAVLYQSQGDPAAAGRYTKQAQTQAILTLLPLGLFGLIFSALALVGVGLLLYFGIRWWLLRSALPDSSPPPDVWPTLRETVPPAERRLRAGDLMGVFVLYLLMPDLLGWVLGGFSLGHHFGVYFGFHGLLSPFRHRLTSAPGDTRVAANVVLSFVAYLVSAGVPIGLLLLIARRKGASVGEELGWNTHRLGWNLLYGVGGYAIALPLLLLAQGIGGFAGTRLHAPTPSNPAMPLLASATTPWVLVMLVLLATVAAPLTEEFLFRGVFYNAAKLRVGVWPAIVLTGLVFGFVHPVGIAQMLPLAALGGVFAWMAETRKSLAPSILAHCIQNSFATLMLLLALAG